jgi:hypothetical protein
MLCTFFTLSAVFNQMVVSTSVAAAAPPLIWSTPDGSISLSWMRLSGNATRFILNASHPDDGDGWFAFGYNDVTRARRMVGARAILWERANRSVRVLDLNGKTTATVVVDALAVAHGSNRSAGAALLVTAYEATATQLNVTLASAALRLPLNGERTFIWAASPSMVLAYHGDRRGAMNLTFRR